MKIMKRFLLSLIIALTALLGLSGCESDAMGDISNEVYIIDYGTVYTSSNVMNNKYIIRDDGIALLVISDFGYEVGTSAPMVNGDRVLINYNVIGDLAPTQLPESCKAGYAIELNALIVLPCQQIVVSDPNTECSPVLINSLHVGKSHLDLRLDYKSIGNKKHEFKLYCPNPDEEIAHLYLVHYGDTDKNDDGVMVTSHRISFNIEALRTTSPRMFTLHWIGLEDAEKVHTGTLNAL